MVELGSVIYSAVKPIFKIYIIVGMGFWLAKRNILSVSTSRDISDTLVRLVLPCLIFNKVVTYLESSDIKNVGIIFFVACLLFFVGVIMTYALSIIAKSPKRWLGGLLSVGLFPNISDLPIAYMQTLSNGGEVFTTAQGDKGVAYIIIFLAAQALFQFTFGLYELIQWDFRPGLEDEEKLSEKNLTDSSHSNLGTPNVGSQSPVEEESPQPIEPAVVRTISEHNSDPISRAISSISRPSTDLLTDDASISSSISDIPQPPPTELEGTSASTSRSQSNTSYHQKLRRRRSGTETGSLYQVRSRDLRTLKSQDMNDVINEYSEYDNGRFSDASRVMSVSTDVGGAGLLTIKTNGRIPLKQKFKQRLLLMAKNLVSPVSATLIAAIAIAMAPPLKALFVESNFHMPNAPDGSPPLSFIIDTTSYVGNASVPFGLLLLGATIARLQVKSMPKGFWKTAVGITLIRLVIMPIFGVGLVTGIHKAGWYDGDELLRFICVLEFGLPSATSLVYFTAFYTDPNSKDHLQMDCLAIALIFQYSLLFLSLPFLVTFTIKVSMGI